MKLDLSEVEFSKKDLIKCIKIPSELTEDLAEDIGIHVGDGSLYRTGTCKTFEIAYSQHIKEVEHTQHIKNLKLKLYNVNRFRSYIKGNERNIRFNSLAIATFYSRIIGLPVGKKRNIDVPEIIKNCNNKKIIAAFIRGIIDTDFSLVFRGQRKYPVLQSQFVSAPLVISLQKLFGTLGIKASISLNLKRFDKRTNKCYIGNYIAIAAKKSLHLALDLIKPKNPKYKNKIKIIMGPA